MPKRIEALSPAKVNRLRDVVGLHAVGGMIGLYLRVSRNAKTGALRRSWMLRATVGERRRDVGLGSFPTVTLERAREKARAERVKIDDHLDPVEERKKARRQLVEAQRKTITFKEAAEPVLATVAANARNPKHAEQWRATLEKYAYPTLGAMPVRDIEREHVLAVLRPLWEGKKVETGSRVRQRVERVLSYATNVLKARSGENPARWKDNLDQNLGRPKRVKPPKPEPSLPWRRCPEFARELRARAGRSDVTARALELLIGTAARTGAVLGATWSELDLARAVWTIPGSRSGVKAPGGDEPIDVDIALCDDAVTLLEDLKPGRPADLVFRRYGRPLSENAMNDLVRTMHDDELSAGREGWIDPKQGGRRVVPHGFRSSFKTWASEATSYSWELSEHALCHVVGNDTSRRYDRTVLLEARRPLMRDWAAFLRSE